MSFRTGTTQIGGVTIDAELSESGWFHVAVTRFGDPGPIRMYTGRGMAAANTAFTEAERLCAHFHRIDRQ